MRLREVLAALFAMVVLGGGMLFRAAAAAVASRLRSRVGESMLLLCLRVAAVVCCETEVEFGCGDFLLRGVLLRKLIDCSRFERVLARGMGAKRTSQSPQISFANTIRMV